MEWQICDSPAYCVDLETYSSSLSYILDATGRDNAVNFRHTPTTVAGADCNDLGPGRLMDQLQVCQWNTHLLSIIDGYNGYRQPRSRLDSVWLGR